MLESLAQAASKLGVAEWRVLGLFALERRLSVSQVETLISGLGRAFVAQGQELGWLVDAGVVRRFVTGRGVEPERAFSLAPALRASVLREVVRRGEFEDVRRSALTDGGDTTRSAFIAALYTGDLALLVRALPELERRATRGQEPGLAQALLHEALGQPFDAAWLERTWGELALALVEQALSDALAALEPVDAAYEYALTRIDASSPARLRWVLAEHALLRGELARGEALLAPLPASGRLGWRAAAAYVGGRFEDAQRLLDEHLRVRGSAQGVASVTALLTLLALARTPPDGGALARRCLPRRSADPASAIANFPPNGAEPAVSRALRTLLRRLTRPESERLRLSVHQLPASPPAWETLVCALTVLLHERDPVVRAGWARRLIADGERAQGNGFAWLARQTLHIARALSAETPPELASLPACRPGELLLADLLEPEPEWRRALGALQGFTEAVERAESGVSRRVAWYVDMTSGLPNKPGLEEFSRGTGWTRGRRVELEELTAVRDTLPPEDQAVLRAIEPARQRRHELPLELVEALAGHPRVFNGARGRLPVEIVRGTCRIETRREHGHLLIALEPAGAREGVNVVVESETRLAVYRVSHTLAKLIELVPSGVRIPEQHQSEAVGVLSRLAEHIEIQSSELGARRKVTADSTPVVRISPESGAWWVELGVRPFGPHGRFFPPGLGRSAITAQAGTEWLDAERSFADERSKFQAVLAACPTLSQAFAEARTSQELGADEVFATGLGEEGLFGVLTELKASDQKAELEWQDSQPIHARGTVHAAALHAALRRDKGWYLVTGGVRLDEVTEVALAELVHLPFTKSGRFLRLPNGDFVEVERRVKRVLSLLASASEAPSRGRPAEIRVPESAMSTLRALIAADGRFDVDAALAEWLAHCDRTLATEAPHPAGLRATLRPYQNEGFAWLWRNSELGLGVCLADDMGLGKTLEAIALLLTRAPGGPALVVAPTSVCRNWLEELARFAPSLRAVEYAGKDRAASLERFRDGAEPTPDVVIASYALLQQDSAELTSLVWHTAVLDEAQFIKNAHSQRARAAYGLSARYRLALTGTPVENHLGDLWSIFHFLNPALLGPFKHFQTRFIKPIERDHDSEQQGVLKALVAPFLLRRMKSEVLAELPPVTLVRHSVRLNDDERMRYALLRRQIHQKLYSVSGKRQHKLQIFAEITRLRRFCCHPRLVFPDAPSESSKLAALFELLEELRENGHRALVFSQFVDFLALVREALEERGFRYLYLDGSTPKELRHTRVQAFQRGEAELFLISLKAGGFGLNLTAADYVIHLDPWWNPAVEAQATDRTHRIGQERPVTVYRLVCEDTIEERILALHADKRALADALLAGNDTAAELTHELLSELVAAE